MTKTETLVRKAFGIYFPRADALRIADAARRFVQLEKHNRKLRTPAPAGKGMRT